MSTLASIEFGRLDYDGTYYSEDKVSFDAQPGFLSMDGEHNIITVSSHLA